MSNDLLTTTFPSLKEFQRATDVLEKLSAEYDILNPSPALSLVALPALVMSREVRSRIESAEPTTIFSGWVDYREPRGVMPDGPAPVPEGVCFQCAAIMVLSPCVADETKIRLIAHLKGDMGPVLPYLNAVIPHASYTPAAETLTFMKGYRMIALYRQRITIAKADDIVDAWLTLEDIRQLAEQTWRDKHQIEPSFEIRRKPPAIEIYKRLPRTNCRQCGELTCLAFAVRVWIGETSVWLCLPVFAEGGEHPRLREPLLDICGGMGVL
jgi:ArsR family metal-binding transcriptional regulator